jgi:hypothetical protein
MAGWWERHFKNDAEKERQARAEEKKKIEKMDGEELREYLREQPSQFFNIVKLDFDGKGNPKAIAEEVDKGDEPNKEKIVARYMDRYGGGDYVVYAYKPVGKVRFATFHVDGDPVYPGTPDKKAKDPIEAAIANAISAIPQADLAKIGPAILANRLGIPQAPPAPVPPVQQTDPILQRRLSMSLDLQAQGKYAEANAILSGARIDTEDGLSKRIRGKLEDRMVDMVTNGGGSQKSEKAEEYEAIGNLIDKSGGVIDRIIKRGASALKGETQDNDDDEEVRCQCANCGKEVPDNVSSCPFCGFKFVEMQQQAPPAPAPSPPPAPPPAFEPPAPPAPLGAVPSPPAMTPVPVPPVQSPSPTLQNPSPPIQDHNQIAGDGNIVDSPEKLGGNPQVGAPATTPTSPAVPKMTKKEREFFDRLLPMIFINRIKRHYGMKYALYFKIAGGFTDATKKETCAPERAAVFDADELKKKHPNEIPQVLRAAKVGFEGMVGKYRPLIEGMIAQYDALSIEFEKVGKSGFMAKYPTVNVQDIRKLREYRKFKDIWDFIIQPKSVAWWNLYCPQLVKSLEGDPSSVLYAPAPPASPAPSPPEESNVTTNGSKTPDPGIETPAATPTATPASPPNVDNPA